MTAMEMPTAVQPPAMDCQEIFSTAWQQSRPGLLVVSLFSVFINLLKLTVPLYILHILDRVISSSSLETLGMLTGITLLAVICGILLEVIRRRMFIAWGNWIESLLGAYLFKAGLRQKSAKVNSTTSLRDLSTVKSFITGTSILAWLDVVWSPLFIVVVFLVAPLLGYIVLAACLMALVLGTANELITRDSRNATYKAGKSNNAWLSITERDPETAGSLSQLNGLAELWSQNASTRAREGMRTRLININFAAAQLLVGRMVRIGVYGFGVWLVIENELSIGSVIAANILGRMAFSQVRCAMEKWRELVLAYRAYGQIKSILRKDIVSHVSLPAGISSPTLKFKDVAYRYSEQSSSVFRRVNLSLHSGELLCLIGPSASGKTTFCRLAGGVVPARSGKILFSDVDIYHLQQNSLDSDIGYLPQEYTLFHGSVRENIAGIPDNDMTMVIRAAKLVGIHEAILKLPKGYDTEIVVKEPQLSVGQRKAIALARTFYGFPILVVLDEPFAHLDNDLRNSLVHGLKKLRNNGGIAVISTQNFQVAQLADKVLAFENGKHFLLTSAKEIEVLQREMINSKFSDNKARDIKITQAVSKIKALRSF